MVHIFDIGVATDYGLEEAIILENIFFWCVKNWSSKNNIHKGRAWTYNSVKSFNEYFTYLTPAKIIRALENLEKGGLIEVDNFSMQSGNRTKWYTCTGKAEKIMNKKISYDAMEQGDEGSETDAKSKTVRIPLIEREPKNCLERVEKAYLLNYRKLYEAKYVLQEKPVINWTASRKLEKIVIGKYGVDNIVKAVNKSIENDFCVKNGYVLTTILSAGVLAKLINSNDSKYGKGSAVTRSGVNDVTKEDIDSIEF